MIEFKEVEKRYPNGYEALRHINLTIDQGEFVAIIGLSGAGKSTLIRTINRMHDITQGQLTVDGTDVMTLHGKSLRKFRRRIGMIFQSFNLITRTTVIKNVLTAFVPDLPWWRATFGIFTKAEKMKALEALDQMGILDKAFVRADQLSGGQQQRVAIARALIVAPDMLLLDEPLSNLDAALRVRMRQELRDIQEKTGVTTLFITHDQQEALSISHRIAVMDKGHIRQIGTPAEIYDRPANQFVANFVGVCNALSPEAAAALGAGERLMCRPEQLMLSREEGGLPVTVVQVRFDGPCYSYTVRHGESLYRVTMFNRPGAFFPAGSSAYMSLYRG